MPRAVGRTERLGLGLRRSGVRWLTLASLLPSVTPAWQHARPPPARPSSWLAMTAAEPLHHAPAEPRHSHHGDPPQRPFCVGVAGATASGKSSVVAEIVRILDAEERVASVTQDSFYKSLSADEVEAASRSEYNFDHPRAFDWDEQLHALSELRRGAARVAIPSYDFTTHSRLPCAHDQHVCAPEIVIFEGILALYDERLRDLFDLKIFVDADADVRLARRIRRDMADRGRDLSGILQQYEQFVKPATESFVVPSKQHADIIVPRGVENSVAIDFVAQHINNVLVQRDVRHRPAHHRSPDAALPVAHVPQV